MYSTFLDKIKIPRKVSVIYLYTSFRISDIHTIEGSGPMEIYGWYLRCKYSIVFGGIFCNIDILLIYIRTISGILANGQNLVLIKGPEWFPRMRKS
jgi:hypothetical protein